MDIENLLLGTAIGDAFGAGVEFQDRDWIRDNVDFTRFINARDRIGVSAEKGKIFTDNYTPWDYTDDTEMTIGMINALTTDIDFTEDLLISKWKEEYDRGINEKGYGRNGHGSMRWFYNGEKTIEEIRIFQKNRMNPGNAPAMRSVPIGLIEEEYINLYAEINANATHPNINAILSSQCIARAAEYLIVKNGDKRKLISYCQSKVKLNKEYLDYFDSVDELGGYDDLEESDFVTLCGSQPIEKPYFLSGIKGMPSDSKFTTGSVLYVLKTCTDAMDALKKSIYLGGDVDSIASITTGIMGGSIGLESIPDFIKNNVEGKDYLRQVASKFYHRITNKNENNKI